MTMITVSRTIAAPIAIVFQACTDVVNLPTVNPEVIGVDFLTGPQSGIGTRFRETRRMGKKEMVTELEVSEFVENEHARMVTDSHGTVWDTLFTVEPRGDQTHLTIAMEARAHKLLPKLLNPVMKGLFRKGLTRHLDALTSYCESKAA